LEQRDSAVVLFARDNHRMLYFVSCWSAREGDWLNAARQCVARIGGTVHEECVCRHGLIRELTRGATATATEGCPFVGRKNVESCRRG
jgi:hypothetical protein